MRKTNLQIKITGDFKETRCALNTIRWGQSDRKLYERVIKEKEEKMALLEQMMEEKK
ncbi:hypothetical protein FACS1894174_03550 [Bacteroidia bacterium]|nr:hypothetical protein FACS1894174_03550 [Bacteroidia bacterium]